MKYRFRKLFALCSILFSLSVYAEDISVPAIVGQTGASATFGKNETDAYTLAIEDWNARGGLNGKRLALQLEDTQTTQQQIVSVFQHLALSDPSVIVGPTWLDGFQAVIPIARKRDVLLVTPSAAREAFSAENKDWPITFYHNSTIEIQTLIEALKQKGHSRFALIYEQEPFAEMIRKLVLDSKIDLVADYGVQGGDTSYQSVLANLRTKKADVLIIFVWDEKSLLTLLQKLKIQLPDLALATVHDGEGWLNNPNFRSSISHLIHTRFVIAQSSFNSRFKRRFGYEPMLTASNAYDALSAVLTAKAAGKTSAKAIREYILTNELDTVTFGKFKFAADGSVPSKVEVVSFSEAKP